MGNSDPGTSGVLTPFGKIEGLYFNNAPEPDDYEFNFKEDLEKILNDGNVDYISIKANNKEDYYKIIDKLYEFNKNCFTVSGTSKDPYTVIMEGITDLDKDAKEEAEGS